LCYSTNIIIGLGKESEMFPTHKDCRNFLNGVCLLFGVPVDPNGPACPRFSAKIVKPSIIQPHAEVDLAELKGRLDRIEAELARIKAALKNL